MSYLLISIFFSTTCTIRLIFDLVSFPTFLPVLCLAFSRCTATGLPPDLAGSIDAVWPD